MESAASSSCSGSLDDAVCALQWDEHLSTALLAVTTEEASVPLVCHHHRHLTGFHFPSPDTTFSLDSGPFSFQTILTVAIVADGRIWGGGTDTSDRKSVV